MRIIFLTVREVLWQQSNDSKRELIQILTVNDRMDEKKVPSSYLDSLDNTPSNTETNYKQFMVSI